MLYQVVTPIIQPRMRFFDADGKPLVGGKVYSCYVGSDVFKPTYRDANKTALNTSPIVLDADGSALIYLNGAHVLKVYDRDGNLIENRYVPETQMRTQFFDKYGVPLKNGKVWTYDIASTIKKTSYANSDVTQLNSNPVVLDAEGWASISMLGSYRLRSYNEKGVSTGDQDFRRPVVKALTSKIYPIYFVEGIVTSFAASSVEQRVLINETTLIDGVGTVFSLTNAITRNPINTYNMQPENIVAAIAILGATLEVYTPYRNTTMSPENVTTEFRMVSATQRGAIVSNTMQPESITTVFSVIGAQITN